MWKNLRTTIAGLGIALLLFPLGVMAAPSGAVIDDSSRDLLTLEGTLEAWDIQQIENLKPLADGKLVATVRLDQSEYTLALKPYSMRSIDFQVQVQVESGELIEVEPPAPATYRGEVIGIPGSKVAASLIRGELTAVIDLGDEMWFVEPLSNYDTMAETSEHVVYRSGDTIPTDRVCGSDLLQMPGGNDDLELMGEPQDDSYDIGYPDYGSRADELTELAFDADYEFYQKNGYSVGSTVADIENVMNGVEVVYQRDTGICYNLTHIIVRSSSNDPYTTNDPGGLLDQFRAEWNSHQSSIQRDTAHMMTGRNMSGNVIGIAWLTVICNQGWGYGLSQSRYTSNFNHRITLTAHELGHNWNAQHCDGDGNCHIMCSGINGCNGVGLPNFGSAAVNTITNYKNSRYCLDTGCGSTLDLVEPDPGLAGQTSTVGVRGATSGATVEFFYSLQSGSTNVPGCSGLTLNLLNARSLAVVTANSNGIATITMMVPNAAAGRTIRLQAADETNCAVSDVEVYTFP